VYQSDLIEIVVAEVAAAEMVMVMVGVMVTGAVLGVAVAFVVGQNALHFDQLSGR
jgi:hypothetical protein